MIIAGTDKIAIRAATTTESTQTKSGLYIPATSDDAQFISGKVVSVGSYIQNIIIGDTVYFNRFTSSKVQTPDGTFYVITEKDVLLVDVEE